ncbi:MAG: cobalt transporter [Moorea sp. SIO3C2]|nr:cobalt transporter [Moorena sp. SIO3C2]
MKRLSLLGSVLALTLYLNMSAALAHAGHGDEFQAEGGVNRVEVNPDTDPVFGIEVNPIEAATEGNNAVMIPVSALVDDNDRQWVFVQYENFYEPVPVTTGSTEGDRIEVLEGLSVGEQLVTQGSLSLYAESRKTQTAEADPEAATIPASEETIEAPAAEVAEEAPETEVAETIEPETVASETAEEPAEIAEASGGFPVGLIAAIGAGIAVVVGGIIVLGGGKKRGA